MNHLPTELIDYIIDFHHSDRRTLKVCSLVCRKWLPASRFHLFGMIDVKPSNAHHFLEQLATPSSTIASHVRNLYVSIGYSYDDTITIFDIIAPYCNTGRCHLVTNDKLDESSSREFGRIGNMDLKDLVYDFSLKTISWTFTLCDSGLSTSVSRLGVHCTGFDYGKQALSWLPILAQLPAVYDISLFRIRENHLPTVQAVLKSCGRSIQAISLNFSLHSSRIALISDYLDLSRVTNLHSLIIHHLDLRKANRSANISKVIQRISSGCVRHIWLNLLVGDWADLAWLDCKKVADELNHSRFSDLQEVRVNLKYFSGEKDEAMAWIRREMSCLDNRNILIVTLD